MRKASEGERPRYTVKATAERAGVSTHQLRLWERRFGLLSPRRSRGGYRLYSDDDVAILAYVRAQSEAGAVIGELATRGRNALLAEARRQPPNVSLPSTELPAASVGDHEALLALLEAGDAIGFERALAQSTLPLLESLLSFELPLLAEIGRRAMAGTTSVAAEHLASSVVRRRLLHYCHNLGLPRGSRPVLLCTVPGDYHDIGLLTVLAHLLTAGVPVSYLGSNLPLEELEGVIERWKPRAVACGVTAPGVPATRALAERLGEIQTRTGCPIFVGGFEAQRRAAVFTEAGVELVDDAAALVAKLTKRT
ncbi:MAG: MerR family transcriptional regulator [Kofleriaceae bacterium]|nr:MerR family transcriptional regulator [Kofleriaceae bacterium]